MKSSMSMDLALFSQKLASCNTLSIFLPMLKSAGTSCQHGAQDFRFKLMTDFKNGESICSVTVPQGATLRLQYDWKNHTDSPHCVQSSGSCSSFPAVVLLQWTWTLKINMTLLTEQTWIKVKQFLAGRYSLESCTEGFVFPYKGYSDQAIPLLYKKRKHNVKYLHFMSS